MKPENQLRWEENGTDNLEVEEMKIKKELIKTQGIKNEERVKLDKIK